MFQAFVKLVTLQPWKVCIVLSEFCLACLLLQLALKLSHRCSSRQDFIWWSTSSNFESDGAKKVARNGVGTFQSTVLVQTLIQKAKGGLLCFLRVSNYFITNHHRHQTCSDNEASCYTICWRCCLIF